MPEKYFVDTIVVTDVIIIYYTCTLSLFIIIKNRDGVRMGHLSHKWVSLEAPT